MLNEGIRPNYVTFVAVLSACDHVGLVTDGFDHFESMANFGIEPRLEYYACMVSLLGRAEKLYEPPASMIWRSLLSERRVVGNLETGIYAAEMAILYILLYSIYANKGM
ncbi:putative tetratricopeptide-like helical domain superfamily [Helianthus annuus]|nr:putative tetratricopeptide-like helical domain superfamily [Helianthus annuus]KAJ0673614.1 putative tetratricopeptide-like helical domain superfamily [Helianthus annuus]KAJ0676972.1 putative tetratricopeptide-like helical domain superfamily [Helianthus annuus]KAJ0861260.1 putative tetratricopeptide-like helical domain superfamily [Helianthus annuus]KAJ0864955.1 putative tetratricopeptide-like helical domain superfamily [Helianthus annuus]